MPEVLTAFPRELLAVFREASPFILLGFAVAGCIQVLMPVGAVQRLLGGGRVRSIFLASLLGIPLPLCSCSVLPTALALRKRGAGRGATISFLISTPETGIDSIALTYGLMDPVMTLFRPFSALVTALSAGFAVEAFGGRSEREPEPESKDEAPPEEISCADCVAEEPEADAPPAGSIGVRLRRGFPGAFRELFDETSHWMLGGLVISALISVFLPAEIVTRYLSEGAAPMVIMLLIGIPMYICASASTPIAAALVLKGLSPGAALVFLLAGPATNIGSLAILARSFGRRVMVIYISMIAGMSLLLGTLLDGVYGASGMDLAEVSAAARGLPGWIVWPAVVVFTGLLVRSFRRASAPAEFRAVGNGIARVTGLRPSGRAFLILVLVALLLFVASTCVLVVPPGYQGLVQRFGAPRGGPLAEGIHAKLPIPLETARLVSTGSVRRVEIGFRSRTPGGAESLYPGAVGNRRLEEESLHLTGDGNILDAKAVLRYRVSDAGAFVWGFADPEEVLRQETMGELLDELAARPIDGVYTEERRSLEESVREGVRRRVQEIGLGVDVLAFGVRSVHAPPEVHAAFRDVASAQEDKQTAVNIAWRYQAETVILARGEAAGDRAAAEGQADRTIRMAEGESRSLFQRAEAFRAHEEASRLRMYLEAIEDVLSGSRKVIRPGGVQAGALDLWIPGSPGVESGGGTRVFEGASPPSAGGAEN